MNKHDILTQSRKENKDGDERERFITMKAEQNAHFLILAVFAFLMTINIWILSFTGKELFNGRTLSLGFFLSLAGQFFTRYCFKKDKLSFLVFCLSTLAFLATFASLILTFLES